MNATPLRQIRHYLAQKQAALEQWLRAAPREKKAIRLGPAPEAAVVSHQRAVAAAVAEADAHTLGVCEVCGDSVDGRLLEMDYTRCVCLAHLPAAQIRALEAELALAQSVQQALLPTDPPDIPGLEIAAYSRPAQFVGGDYFDFVAFSAECHGLVLADVAGHGVSASLQMAGLQALTRAIVPTHHSPADVIAHLQRLFVHNVRFSTFASLFLGAYDPATRRLTYANAGHNPPLVLGPEPGAVPTWLTPTGPALGLIQVAEFGERAVTLAPGQVLVMYTDGIVEARDAGGALYGAARLVEQVRHLHAAPPREIVRGLRESVEAFVGPAPLSDDITLVVARVG